MYQEFIEEIWDVVKKLSGNLDESLNNIENRAEAALSKEEFDRLLLEEGKILHMMWY